MDRMLTAFESVVRTSEPHIDLGLAALTIAQIEHPDLIPDHYVKQLDELASRACAWGACDDALRALHRLREFLFEEEGFRGNSADYYDPHNSCLSDVIDRKLGIPITLSVLMMEVGHRLGLSIAGVGLPGHFVVSAQLGADRVLLDPFDGGAVLTPDRAADLVAQAVGRRVELTEENFAPVSKRQILIRMLANLRKIYGRREEWRKLLAVLESLLILDEESATAVRDRGTVLLKLGQVNRGLADWQHYLTRCPDAPDAPRLKEQLRRVRCDLARLN